MVASPVANFTVSTNSGCQSSQVFSFQNISTNYDSCLWDFGDGTTSSVTHPQHIYNIPGSFNVFDNNVNTLWISSTNSYGTTANNEINAISNSSLDYYTEYKNSTTEFTNWLSPNPGRIYGEYIQIALPYAFVLTNVSILNDNTNQAAKYIFVAGSSNGSDWYILSRSDPENAILYQNQENDIGILLC